MSTGSPLPSELADWSPPSADQRTLRDEFLAYADAHEDAASRECRPDHLTASAIVLDSTGGHVLLGLHGKVGRWLQFGGHIEVGDGSLRAAALRETVEESGLTALTLSSTPLRLDRHRAPCGARYHLDVQFLALVDGLTPPTVSAESRDVAWFAVEALPTECDDSVRALVAAARSAVAAGSTA